MQCLRINPCSSDSRVVISGVPQDSVLGPVLFVLYVNDITGCADSPVTDADDTKVYSVIADGRSAVRLQSLSIDFIFSWSKHWQLKPSPSNVL